MQIQPFSLLKKEKEKANFGKPDPLLSCNRILPGNGRSGPGDLRGAASRRG
jgi:hypothetical protein